MNVSTAYVKVTSVRFSELNWCQSFQEIWADGRYFEHLLMISSNQFMYFKKCTLIFIMCGMLVENLDSIILAGDG
jgi:hypothetical protein